MSQQLNHLLAMGTSSKLAEKFSTVKTHTLEPYRQYISGTWLRNTIEAYRAALATDKDKAARLKKSLPIRCAHYYHFVNDHRSQNDLDKDAFLFQTTVDIDEFPDGVTTDMIIAAVKTLDTTDDTWRGKVLHIEYSASKKLHVDIRMLMGTTIEQSQMMFIDSMNKTLNLTGSNALHTDTSCFSPERCIFITGDDIYTSPHWYEVLPDSELAAYRAALSNVESSKLNVESSTLNVQPSTFNPQPSTLNPQPSTFNPQRSTLNLQPSTASLTPPSSLPLRTS